MSLAVRAASGFEGWDFFAGSACRAAAGSGCGAAAAGFLACSASAVPLPALDDGDLPAGLAAVFTALGAAAFVTALALAPALGAAFPATSLSPLDLAGALPALPAGFF